MGNGAPTWTSLETWDWIASTRWWVAAIAQHFAPGAGEQVEIGLAPSVPHSTTLTTDERDVLKRVSLPEAHQNRTTPSATNTTCPPTRTAVGSSSPRSTSTYSVLGRLISAPCSLTMWMVGPVTDTAWW